jgi:hypothetical protein
MGAPSVTAVAPAAAAGKKGELAASCARAVADKANKAAGKTVAARKIREACMGRGN